MQATTSSSSSSSNRELLLASRFGSYKAGSGCERGERRGGLGEFFILFEFVGLYLLKQKYI